MEEMELEKIRLEGMILLHILLDFQEEETLLPQLIQRMKCHSHFRLHQFKQQLRESMDRMVSGQ